MEQSDTMDKCNYSEKYWMSVVSLISVLRVTDSHGVDTLQMAILFGRDLTEGWLMLVGSLHFQVQLFITFIAIHLITCLSVLACQVWNFHDRKRCLDLRRCGFLM